MLAVILLAVRLLLPKAVYVIMAVLVVAYLVWMMIYNIQNKEDDWKKIAISSFYIAMAIWMMFA